MIGPLLPVYVELWTNNIVAGPQYRYISKSVAGSTFKPGTTIRIPISLNGKDVYRKDSGRTPPVTMPMVLLWDYSDWFDDSS